MLDFNKLGDILSALFCRQKLLPSLMMSGLVVLGCSPKAEPRNGDDESKAQLSAQVLADFEGCYTVSHSEPAQIKISQKAGSFVMQMKEPARANRIWDDPEPLKIMPLSKVHQFFSIDPQYVEAMLARPDGVFVLAQIDSAYANIDPLLDSEFLSYIYQGANTIYKVDCDSLNLDILSDPHASITIDSAAN